MIQRVSKFRLITASNIPLHQLIEQKKLRQDLYYRLNKIIISIPPLRERKEDIPLLISHFLTKIGETRLPDDETLSRMINYSWPGNVRELYHELERLSVFAPHEAQALSFKEILTDSVLNL
jgi:transcriptional regulator with PAS, ATPase and Fis domain